MVPKKIFCLFLATILLVSLLSIPMIASQDEEEGFSFGKWINNVFRTITGQVISDPGCGSVVTDDVILTTDMNCSATVNGLVVGADDITIDCQGHAIIGGIITGIDITQKSGVTVRDCKLVGTGSIENRKIQMYQSHNCTFEDNEFIGNPISEGDTGIEMQGSSQNKFLNNNFTDNHFGFNIANSNHNLIAGNEIAGASVPVRYDSHQWSEYNNITKNNIHDNFYAVYTDIDRYNTYWLNEFVNNTQPAFLGRSFANNEFNNTDISPPMWPNPTNLGNHWDTYDESTEGCFDNNTDNICDSPYNYGADLIDYYPLVGIGGGSSNDYPPEVNNIILNASTIYNTTCDDLIVSYTITDSDGNPTKGIVDWRAEEGEPTIEGTSLAVLNMPGATGSIPVIKDFSSYGNNGTMQGALLEDNLWEASGGYDGWSYFEMDGVDDIITIPYNSGLNVVGEVTVAAWINPSIVSGYQRIWSYGGSSQANAYSLLLNNDKLTYQINNAGHGSLSTDTISVGTWTHVAFTYDDSLDKVILYVNGNPTEYSTSRGINPVIETGYIGASSVQGQLFNGGIDEVLVYDRVLSPEQIQLLASGESDIMSGEETIDWGIEGFENWKAKVTPWDGLWLGDTGESNVLTIQNCLPGDNESLSLGNCNDGIDNDCDCLLDGQDPDCGASNQLDISLNLNPNPVNVSDLVVASGHLGYNNGTDIANHPVSIFMDGVALTTDSGKLDLSGGSPTNLGSTTYAAPDGTTISSSSTWGSVSLSEIVDGIVSTSSSKGWIAGDSTGQVTFNFPSNIGVDKIAVAARYSYAPGTSMHVEVSSDNGASVEQLFTSEPLTQDLQNFTIDRNINWMRLNLSDGNWVGVNELEIYSGESVITNANGDYSYQFTAPSVSGIKTLLANTSYGGENLQDTELLEVINPIEDGKDLDMDGYCECPECPANGYNCVYPEEDCNDTNYDVNPGATENCTNGIDDDCDGDVDYGDSDCGFVCPDDTVSYWSLNSQAFPGVDNVNSNNGATYGANWTSSGRAGGALDFDGTDDYVEVLDADNLDMVDELTIAAWIYPHSYDDVYGNGIFDKSNFDGASGSYRLAINAIENKAIFRLKIQGEVNDQQIASINAISLNQWTYVVGTYDGSNMKLYINGELDVQEPQTGDLVVDDYNLRIGQYLGPNRFFDGIIDEVTISNRSWDSTEINDVYNSGLNGLGVCVGGGSASGQDNDLDGYCECPFCPPYYLCTYSGHDCNDFDFDINPGAVEICDDGIDNNCDNLTDTEDTVTCPIDCNLSGISNYWTFDEGSASDYFGGNNGIVYGAVSAPGKVGSALSFDGASDYVSVADDDSLNFGNFTDFSVGAWIKTDTYDGMPFIVSKGNYAPNGKHWHMAICHNAGGCSGYAGNFIVTIDDGTNYQQLKDTAVVTDNAWHYVVATFDRDGYMRAYVDGIEQGTALDISGVGNVTTTHPLAIGIYSNGLAGNDFNGIIDEPAIFDRVLTPIEVLQLYNNGLTSKSYCEAFSCLDSDSDTYFGETLDCVIGDDCLDTNYDINPGAVEICDDGIDNNCDNLTDTEDIVNCPVSACYNATTLVSGYSDDNVVCSGTNCVLQGDVEFCDGQNGFVMGADNMHLNCQGYKLNGSNDSNGYGVWSNNRAGTQIRNCEITNFIYGVRITNSKGNAVLENNKVYNIGDRTGVGGGLYLHSDATIVPTNNIIRNNNVSDVGSYPIYDGYGTDDLIENNFVNGVGNNRNVFLTSTVIYRNNTLVNEAAEIYGVGSEIYNNTHKGGIVSWGVGNEVYDNDLTGTLSVRGNDSIVRNNYVHDAGSIDYCRKGGASTYNIVIRDNIVENASDNGIWGSDGGRGCGYAVNLTILNNTIYAVASGGIRAEGRTNDSWIVNNTVYGVDGLGTCLDASGANNLIEGNEFNDCKVGIRANEKYPNNLTGNIIRENNIVSCWYRALYIGDAQASVYHNNIYGTEVERDVDASSAIYPIDFTFNSSGNFWGRTNTSEPCFIPGVDSNHVNVTDSSCYWQMYGWLYACEDADNDGHPAIYCGGDDCNDNDNSIYPGAVENTSAACQDGIDNDCDGNVDMNDSDCMGVREGVDMDLDGYCECPFCPPVYNCVFGGNDCNDLNENIHPGAVEVCNGVDDNCNNLTDENNGDCGGTTPYCIDGSCKQCVDNSDCDDGLWCNGLESCVENQCLAGDAPVVNDNVSCTIDSCDEVNDVVTHTPDDTICLDGAYCNGQEYCDSVNDCQAGTAPTCDDGILCTLDSCDEGIDLFDNLGSCVFNTSACECEVDADCDDGNSCTDDSCVNLECVNTNNDNNTCNDGLFCTVNDRCESGSCVADVASVDDSVSCTTDSCDEELDVFVHTPVDAICDNGLYCDGAEVCSVTEDCQAGVAPSVDDGVSCTVDSCNEENDTILHLPDDSLCLNGLYCDGAEFCDVNLDCQLGTSIVCDDGVPCTVDSCEEGVDTNDNLGNCEFDTSGCECTSDAQCDDGNPCTDDSCVAFACINSDNDLNSCDDGFFCTVNDRCSSGSCVSDARDVDDSVGCTLDSCDEDLDVVVHNPLDSVCDNGLFCDGEETCDALLDCQAGTAPVINDGVGCTNDYCDEDTDTITHTPDNSLCLDGSYCNGAEFCSVTEDCQAGTPPNCDDNILCTINGCDEGVDLFDNVGDCTFDNSPCECEVDADCDDGNPCTDDVCNAQLECESTNNDANSCNDGFFCTVNDRCDAGSCVADSRNLDDSVSCTTDSCDEVNDVVVHTPVDSVCDDGAYCNGAEVCDVLLDCQAGTAPNTDDSVSCTVDSCDEVNDIIVHVATDSLCDNGLFCDGEETCNQLLDCQAGIAPSVDDGVSCTVDSCDETNDVIVNVADDSLCLNGLYCDGAETCDAVNDCQAGTPPVCDDGIFCTLDDCSEGANLFDNVGSCVSDTAPCECEVDADCDDGNPCTDDVCNAQLECENNANDANTCNDGFFCTVNDRCEAGVCTSDARNVNDLIGCTIDSCDEDNDVVVHTENNAVCDNGLYCDGQEYCDALLDCQAGTAPNVDDGVSCTIDTCNEATDSITHVADDSVCLDGAYCNGAEFCDALLDCQAGTPPTCDDGIFCTADSCDEGVPGDNVGSCIFDTVGCECVDNADCNDNNPCTDDVCNANFECVNTADDSNACSDNAWCTINDRCEAGSCVSDLRNVDDGIDCTVDSCDEMFDVIVNNPSNIFCDDGLYCNGAEVCNGDLGCLAGTAPVCDDGLACTLDSCNELTDGCSFTAIDNDGDGYDICAGASQDCDDSDENVHPGAVEVCDGIDNDCNGLVDEGCAACGNGVLDFPEQCDDGNVNDDDGCSSSCVSEQIEEECADNIEIVDNGDGTYDYTLYNNGIPILVIENNVGLIDWQDSPCEREDQSTWIFKRIGFSISDLVLTGTTKDVIFENKALICAVDDNEFRSGNLLGEFGCFLHPDRISWSVFNGNPCGAPGSPVAGRDRFGADTSYTCEIMTINGTDYARLSGFTHTTVISIDDKDNDGWSVEEDCDDTDAFVNPGVDETCDGVDNNCDGLVDYEAVVGDLDGTCGTDSCEGTDVYFNYYCDEGTGCATEEVIEDSDSDGYNGLCSDCNDNDADIHPGAQEICPDDGIDNNCDGTATFDCEAACDADGDGYFTTDTWYCFGSDCDDGNANINPGAEEICDGVDNNCDGDLDNRDADNDDVNDCSEDRCLNTVVPEGVPQNRFNRLLVRHYAEIDGDEIFETRDRILGPIVDSDYDLVDTYGCSCEQILECKPGKNKGEYLAGCSKGTMRVWINQQAWAPDCQWWTPWGFKTFASGVPKDEDEDTDEDGINDDEDEDDDNDGVNDEDDEEPEAKPDPVTNEPSGKPKWWCRLHPNKC